MRFIFLIFLVLVLMVVVIQHQRSSQTNLNNLKDQILHPFDERLHYRVGDIDPLFAISKQELIQISQEAAQIWQDGLGKELFVYDPNATLQIHLIYDERQAESSARQVAKQHIEQDKITQAQQKQKLEQQKVQLDQKKSEIDRIQEELNHRVYQLNERIQRFNHSAYRDREELNDIQYQQDRIREDRAAFQRLLDAYNHEVSQLNQATYDFNRSVQHLNQTVADFNSRFSPQKFDKGQFDGKTIRIYEFQSRNDLKLTIAHELGHALGLKHHDDPKALMYPVLQQQDLDQFRLRPADIALYQQR